MTNDQAIEQIENFDRVELRTACKSAGIQYSKMKAHEMRAALIALLPVEVEPQGGEIVPPPGWETAGGETDAPKTGLKIEKNREERNGIKRPSAGGKCRAVWDVLDNLVAQPTATVAGVTSKQVKELASQHGFNFNNASIEFYQWRKFNGVTGRASKE